MHPSNTALAPAVAPGPPEAGAGGALDRPPMVAALSPSSITAWHQCPKRFFFEKILRLDTPPVLEAVCGTFVHGVLERLMELAPEGRQLEAARRLATEQWAPFISDVSNRFAELGLDEAAVKAFKRRAWAGVSGYFALEDPTAVDVVATEQEVRAELDGAPLFGIVDRLERVGDQLVVADYKTGKAPKWPEEIDEKLGQLRLYAAVLAELGTPVAAVRLLFVSPQLSAGARAERCARAAVDALDALVGALPGRPVGRLEEAVYAVEEVAQASRAAAEPGGAGREQVRIATAGAGWSAATLLVEEAGADPAVVAAPVEEVARLLMDVVAARRSAYFAGRDARESAPRQITLDVDAGHLAAARAEVATVWSEANDCYDRWEFPGRTGPLCHWCPFRDRCDAFAAWSAADDSGSSAAAGSSVTVALPVRRPAAGDTLAASA